MNSWNVWLVVLTHLYEQKLIDALVNAGLTIAPLSSSGKVMDHSSEKNSNIIALSITTDLSPERLNNLIDITFNKNMMFYHAIVISKASSDASWRQTNIVFPETKSDVKKTLN
jgi:hypothetical protein